MNTTANASTESYRRKIYDSILDTVGMTPLVRINRITEEANCKATIVCKCEFFNPLSSVKDRIGLAMINAAEESGELKPGGTVVEPTSGNTGIALAFVCAAKGYRLILTMPDSMSVERRKMLNLLGAEIILTPAQEGMNGAIIRAEKILKQNRVGDHIWYVSSMRKFRKHYPHWEQKYDNKKIIEELIYSFQ